MIIKPRYNHAALSHNTRLYVIGGTAGGVRFNDVLSSEDGVTWRDETENTKEINKFPARRRHGAVLHNGRIYVVAGNIGGKDSLNDVWSSEDGKEWRLETEKAQFLPRGGCAVLSHKGLLYVIGGAGGGKRFADVWHSKDGKKWEQATENAQFGSRLGFRAVPHGERIYVISGSERGKKFSDVWSSKDGEKWDLVTEETPFSPRNGFGTTTHGERIYVIGGFDGAKRDDVWSSEDGKDWHPETEDAPFPERRQHAIVSHGGRLYVIGGKSGETLGDVWVSSNENNDGKTWTLPQNDIVTDLGIADLPPTDVSPAPTLLDLFTSVSVAERMLPDEFSGEKRLLNDDLFLLNNMAVGSNAIAVLSPPPAVAAPKRERFPGRYAPAAFSHGGRLWIIGGGGAGKFFADVWSSDDGGDWRNETKKAPFGARHAPGGTSHDGRLWIIGGANYAGHYNDVWTSENGKEWKQVMIESEHFSRRRSCGVVSHDGRIYVIGGHEVIDKKRVYHDDVWASEDGKKWTQEAEQAPFSPRKAFGVVSHGERIYVIGGASVDARLNDIWSSADGKEWRKETGSADFSPRAFHAVASCGERICLFGGYDGDSRNDAWSSADGKKWREEAGNEKISPRSGCGAAELNGRVYVLAGAGAGVRNRLNDVWSSSDHGASWKSMTAPE